MTARDDGIVTFGITGESGVTRAALQLDECDTVKWLLCDSQGRTRAVMAVHEGTPGFVLADEKEKQLAMLRLLPEKGAELELRTKDGAVWRAP